MRRFGLWSAAALVWTMLAGADEPVKKLQVVSPKDNDILATAINNRGDVVGFEWVEEKPDIVSQVPFFARGKEMTRIPLLAGYTATFPAAVSDDGRVAGRVGKPAPLGVRVFLRNQAFVWDAKGGIRGLGALKDDFTSFGCGITRDGRRVSGFSVGDQRMRACVWDRDGDGWKGTAMPHQAQLASNVVPISGNGKYVSAVDGVTPCLWTQGSLGEWTREAIAEDGSLIPRAVNDSGTVVGVRFTGDGLMHAVLWSRAAGYKQLDKPKDYVRSEALAINNEGVVVGMIDGPHGSKVEPKGFVYRDGQIRLIDEGGPNLVSATAINDHDQVAGVVEKDDEAEAKPGKPGKDKPKPAGSAPKRP